MIEPVTNYRFVITGGPGSGKTSLIKSLESMGFIIFLESSRDMIQDGREAPIRNLQARKEGSFFKEILKKRIVQHQAAPQGDTSFFDRGIPDSLAFIKYMGIEAPQALRRAVDKYRYHSTIFLLPPWKEIYQKDSIRQENYSEAEKLFWLIKEAYKESGYLIFELPQSSIQARARLITEKLEDLINY